MKRSPVRTPVTALGRAIRLGAFGLPLALAGVACTGLIGDDGSATHAVPDAGDPMPEAGVPFEALSVTASVTKVKRLLTGLPPTSDEVSQVAANPAALRDLIDGWIKTPQYSQKMREFFMNSFQQTQLSLTGDDFALQTGGLVAFGGNAKYVGQMQENLQESFARTVIELINNGRPFTEVLTTKSFMLTPALAIYYAYLDDTNLPDAQAPYPDDYSQIMMNTNNAFVYTVTGQMGPLPPLTFFNPDLPTLAVYNAASLSPAELMVDDAFCQTDPRVYTQAYVNPSRAWDVPWSLFSLIYDGLQGFDFPDGLNPALSIQCLSNISDHDHPQITESDFTQWTMTSIRQPAGGEATTLFYDLAKLRSATELVLRTPRVGFFTTPSFFAQWPTNNNNKNRVLINQTLIGAVGQAFSESTYTPAHPNGQDLDHTKAAKCASCHATMDPMAQFFRQAYTLSYTHQGDPKQTSVPGIFAFGGETEPAGNGVYDLGAKLAASPEFALGWAQKLCYFANSSRCEPTDPEFLRVVEVFKNTEVTGQKYQWPVLVKELFSSPLVTETQATVTATTVGVTTAVDRRAEFCDLLSFRLEIPNLCGLGLIQAHKVPPPPIATLATGLPADGYTRGVVTPFLSNAPTLFLRAGVEQLCLTVADSVIDAPGTSKYVSASPDAAIADFAQNLMGLPTADARYPAILAILTDHFNQAMAPGDAGDGDGGAVIPASASDALKSTFVLACTSPLTVSVGL